MYVHVRQYIHVFVYGDSIIHALLCIHILFSQVC